MSASSASSSAVSQSNAKSAVAASHTGANPPSPPSPSPSTRRRSRRPWGSSRRARVVERREPSRRARAGDLYSSGGTKTARRWPRRTSRPTRSQTRATASSARAASAPTRSGARPGAKAVIAPRPLRGWRKSSRAWRCAPEPTAATGRRHGKHRLETAVALARKRRRQVGTHQCATRGAGAFRLGASGSTITSV